MKLFTVNEVSKILRVTPKSVRDFINSGRTESIQNRGMENT